MAIGVGLLGLGTVGAGVAAILNSPEGRHPLVGELALRKVAVRDLNRPRPVELAPELLSTDPEAVVDDPAVEIVVEVIGGLEPARTLILRAIAAGKPVVTANKAVIARHGEEIAAAAAAAGGVRADRGGGGRGDPDHRTAEAVAGGQPHPAGERHHQRHHQLHPQPHGR
jgi:homoserine dehydrogenase